MWVVIVPSVRSLMRTTQMRWRKTRSWTGTSIGYLGLRPDEVDHQLLVDPAVVHERASQRAEVHDALLALDERAAPRRRPLRDRDGGALDGRQEDDRLDVRRVDWLLDALPELLVLPPPNVMVER